MSRTDEARRVWLEQTDERRARIVEEVELLLSSGSTGDEVARRLGARGPSLARFLYRAGRPDLGRVVQRHCRRCT